MAEQRYKIGVLPTRNTTEYTTASYLTVTFRQLEIVNIGNNVYQSLVDNNVGNALSDASKWVCLVDNDAYTASFNESEAARQQTFEDDEVVWQAAIDAKLDEIDAMEFDDEPVPGSIKAVKSGGLYVMERRMLPYNVIDVSSYPPITGALGPNTVWSTGRKGVYIPVKEGDTYQLSVSGRDSNYAFMTTYVTPKAGDTMPLVSGTSRELLENNHVVSFTAPTGTRFIFLQTYYDDDVTITWTCKHVPHALGDTDELTAYEKIDTSELVLVSNYVSGSTGKWTDGGSSNGGVFVPLTPNKTYKFATYSTAMDMSVLTTNEVVVGETPSFATSYANRVAVGSGKYFVFTAPSNAAYMFVHSKNEITIPFAFYESVPLKDAIPQTSASGGEEYGVIDLSSYDRKTAAIGDTEWLSRSDRLGIFMPVEEGECFEITQKQNSFNYAFLTTDTYKAGDAVAFASGCHRETVQLNNSKFVKVPNGAKFLFLQVSYSSSDSTPIVERVRDVDYSEVNGKKILSTQILQDGLVVSKSEYKYAFNTSIGLAPSNGIFVTYAGNQNKTDGDEADHNNVMASTLWNAIDGMTKSELQPITTYQDANGDSLGSGYKWRNGMHVKYGNSMGAFYCISVANASDYSFGYNHSLEETTMTQCKLSYNDGTAKLVEFTGNNYRQMLVDMGFRDAYVASGTYNMDNQSIVLYNGAYYIVLCTYMRSDNSNKYPLVLLSSSDLATWTVQKMLGTSLHSASEIKFTINDGKIYLIYRNQTSSTQNDGTNGYYLCCYNMADGSALYEENHVAAIMSLPAAFTFNGKSYLAYMQKPFTVNASLTYPYYRQQMDVYEANADGVSYKFSMYNPTGFNYPVFLTIPANSSYISVALDRLYVAWSEDRRNLNYRQINNVTLANVTSLFV